MFNVEGNFLPNIDYAYCFQHGIRVLNISPVFAEPVAEAALGMAIDLARGISRSDRHFRQGTGQYGLAANIDAFSLFRLEIGFIGLGDLGRAILPLLRPFGCQVGAWTRGYLRNTLKAWDVQPALWMRSCSVRVIFVVAGATSQNQGFLGARNSSLNAERRRVSPRQSRGSCRF